MDQQFQVSEDGALAVRTYNRLATVRDVLLIIVLGVYLLIGSGLALWFLFVGAALFGAASGVTDVGGTQCTVDTPQYC